MGSSFLVESVVLDATCCVPVVEPSSLSASSDDEDEGEADGEGEGEGSAHLSAVVPL